MKTEQITQALLPKIKEVGITKETLYNETSFAVQHVAKSKTLQNADGSSILQAVWNVCQVGLSLNPIKKEGYLVPRWDSLKRINTVAFEASYQGLVKLLTDSGSVETIYSQLVYENDEFEVSYGTETNIVHKPTFKDRGEMIAVYAVAVLPSGLKVPEVMTIEEINAIKDTSDSYKAFKAGKIKSCVWSEYYGEMARKTVIRRIFKYLPKTEKADKLFQAINYDEQDYTAKPEQLNYIDSLLESSTLGPEKKFAIETEMEGYSQSQAAECINYLKNNQIDNIDAGYNYGQKEIHKKLDKMGL